MLICVLSDVSVGDGALVFMLVQPEKIRVATKSPLGIHAILFFIMLPTLRLILIPNGKKRIVDELFIIFFQEIGEGPNQRIYYKV